MRSDTRVVAVFLNRFLIWKGTEMYTRVEPESRTNTASECAYLRARNLIHVLTATSKLFRYSPSKLRSMILIVNSFQPASSLFVGGHTSFNFINSDMTQNSTSGVTSLRTRTPSIIITHTRCTASLRFGASFVSTTVN